MLNIIIGKRSNLSKHLSKHLGEAMVVSASQAVETLSALDWHKHSQVNLILNQFQPATRLNDLSDPMAYIDNAIVSTASILACIQDQGSQINKILYTSSSSVYGNSESCIESHLPSPLSLHATLKLANEKLVAQFCNMHNIDYVIARVFNMYGGDDQFSIISKIIQAYQANKAISLINQGQAVRDFIHIEDVVNAYCALLKSSETGIVNIASAQSKSVAQVLHYLTQQQLTIATRNIEREEIKVSVANNERLQRVLGVDYQFKTIENYLLGELLT